MKFNPMKDSTNIQIRLIRKGLTGPDEDENDDLITIHYKGETTYHLYYKDGNTDAGVTHFTVLEAHELDTYIMGLFKLVAADRDGFKYVQFIIPSFPSVMFTAKDLTRKVVRNKLMQVMPLMHTVGRVHLH